MHTQPLMIFQANVHEKGLAQTNNPPELSREGAAIPNSELTAALCFSSCPKAKGAAPP